MSEIEERAAARLADMVRAGRGAGLVDVVAKLVRDVWTQGLDRYEPEEMGDTTRSLGFTATENMRILAERRFREDQQWAIDSLAVAAPRGSLQLTFAGAQIRFMKVGPEHRRKPDWAKLDWGDGEVRRQMAERNSAALGGYRTPPANPGLFDLDEGEPDGAESLNDFLLVWAGDLQETVTAGWLTVPVLGERPFLTPEPLWWDDTPGTPERGRRRPTAPDGDSFTDKASPTAAVTLRPGAGQEREA